MCPSRAQWLADLRRAHRPETILTLLQLQALGPGLYTIDQLSELLGVGSSSLANGLSRLRCAGLLGYVGWFKKGTLIWWIAAHDDQKPDTARQYPRWILRANAACEIEILFGKQQEAAKRLCVDEKTLRNFLCHRYESDRLLRKWSIWQDPVQFVTRNQC